MSTGESNAMPVCPKCGMLKPLHSEGCGMWVPAGVQGDTHMEVRKWLWVNHGCPIGSLYGDDGEMQCNNLGCRLDFKRADLLTLIQRTHVQQAEEIARLRVELETRDMQLAGCGTAAIQNTLTSASERIEPGHPYYTVAYGDVCRAVDREMKHRDTVQALQAHLAEVQQRIRELEASLKIAEGDLGVL